MSLPVGVSLINVSVVLVAKHHNPSLLNPDFLRSNGLAEKDTSVRADQTLVTPAFSRIVFENGISWTVDPDRCTIQEDINDSLREEYRIHQSAIKYAETLPHLPYLAMGLNWKLWWPVNEPDQWLKQQFMNESLVAETLVAPTSMIFRFSSIEGSLCILNIQEATLNIQSANNENLKQNGIIADFNFHFNLSSIEEIKSKINIWMKKQTEMESIFEKYIWRRLA